MIDFDPFKNLPKRGDPRREGGGVLSLPCVPLPPGRDGERIVIVGASHAVVYEWCDDAWDDTATLDDNHGTFCDAGETGHRWAWVKRVAHEG